MSHPNPYSLYGWQVLYVAGMRKKKITKLSRSFFFLFSQCNFDGRLKEKAMPRVTRQQISVRRALANEQKGDVDGTLKRGSKTQCLVCPSFLRLNG